MDKPYRPFGGREPSPEGAGGELGGPVSASFLGGGNGSGNGGGSDSGDIDSAGTRWDANLHNADKRRNRDGTWSRKRGRTTGSATGGSGRSKSTQAGYQAGIESLTSILTIVHVGLANLTKTPELQLEDTEAEILAKASAEVMVQFDIAPNPKVQAVVGLVMAAGSVYGPRVYLIRERRKEEREKANG